MNSFFIHQEQARKMDPPFDFQNDDPYLRFIRDDSSHNNSGLFKNEGVAIKIEEQELMQNQLSQPKEETVAVKRKRSENNMKSSSKKKMFYRDKMATLISEKEMLEKQDYNYGEYCQNGRGKSPISREEQLRRNRQSAKHSRQRRKEYVETLEEKNVQNQQLIQQLTQKLSQVERERDRLRQDNRSYIKAFLDSKNQEYEKMSNILKMKGKKCDEMISQQLKIMKAKFGAAGSERVATTDYYMKEIIEILLGDVHKYLMHCALQNSGIFGMNTWTSLDDQICNILRVQKDIRINLSKNYRQQMLQEFQTFKDITQKFYDAYRAIQNQARIIEKLFQKVSLEFSDQHIAELLIWIQQNKYNKEIKKIRAEWKASVESREEEMGNARKLSKYQIANSGDPWF